MVMELRHMKKRLSLGIAALLAAMSFGQQASAACVAATPWNLNGSDTWFDVVTTALVQANTDCPANPAGIQNAPPYDFFNISNLHYAGGGSGAAETNLQQDKQGFGPMSRAFKQAVINAFPAGYFIEYVGGLDAIVIITKQQSGKVTNINLPVAPLTYYPALANSTPAGCDFNTPGSCYTQLLEIVLAGPDGSGTVAACSSPARVQAINDLAALQHTATNTISHFYRRDDNSGTTDTIKERLGVGNFCNGRARGIYGTPQIAGNFNTVNEDHDPIRRPCPDLNASYKQATCTDMTTGLFCKAADANPNCTQGLVVAISDPDPGISDFTVSIGRRVGADPAGASFGYAGREAKKQLNASAPAINRIDSGDSPVRDMKYMNWRQLFLMNAPRDDDDQVNEIEPVGDPWCDQRGTEEKFWLWATDDGLSNCNGNSGRCNLDPILKRYGFLPCEPACGNPLTPGKACSNPPERLPSAPAFCIPNDTNGGPWGYGAVACTAGSTCCSTGLACPGSLTCPAVGSLPLNSACAKNSDCASGTCGDAFLGINVCI